MSIYLSATSFCIISSYWNLFIHNSKEKKNQEDNERKGEIYSYIITECKLSWTKIQSRNGKWVEKKMFQMGLNYWRGGPGEG